MNGIQMTLLPRLLLHKPNWTLIDTARCGEGPHSARKDSPLTKPWEEQGERGRLRRVQRNVSHLFFRRESLGVIISFRWAEGVYVQDVNGTYLFTETRTNEKGVTCDRQVFIWVRGIISWEAWLLKVKMIIQNRTLSKTLF